MHSASQGYMLCLINVQQLAIFLPVQESPCCPFLLLSHRKEVFIQTLTPALHPEVRSLVGIPALPLASCVSSGSYNKTPQGWWLINGRNWCLRGLKPENPRSGCQHDLPCLTAGTFTLCPHMVEGAGNSLDSHLLGHESHSQGLHPQDQSPSQILSS